MSKYEMQVKVNGVFTSLKASHSDTPYRYETVKEAECMLSICYPDQHRICGETRIVNLNKEPVDFSGNVRHGILKKD